MCGGKTILDDLLRELRPRFLPPPRSFQRTRYRPGELAQFDLCEPRAEIPVGWGQTRRGYVVTCELPYSRAFAGALVFSKEFSDIAFGMSRCLAAAGGVAGQAGLGSRGRDRAAGPPDRAVPGVLRPARAGLGDPRRGRLPGQGRAGAQPPLPARQLRSRPQVRERARLPGTSSTAGAIASTRGCTARRARSSPSASPRSTR